MKTFENFIKALGITTIIFISISVVFTLGYFYGKDTQEHRVAHEYDLGYMQGQYDATFYNNSSSTCTMVDTVE